MIAKLLSGSALLRTGAILIATASLALTNACAEEVTGGAGTAEPEQEAAQGETTSKMKKEKEADESGSKDVPDRVKTPEQVEIATLAGGCFWCTEAVMERLDGVVDVVSGYMGGTVDDPSYKEICTGTTGHAEAIQVTYDPEKITFDDLLDIFWQAHDPTTLNRQGADVGTQYRSAIFYHDDEQKKKAEASIARLDASGAYDAPVVTEVTEAGTFWKAEVSHQDYYRLNKDKNPYCQIVISPKMRKLGLE